MGKIALALIALSASADGLGANDGSSSRDACEADCTGSGDERRCVFEARLDIHASSTGYYKFAQCGSTPQPVLAMEQGVEYTFRQKSASNWFHPLGFAYAPDGAHRGHDELEPGISKSSDKSCEEGNSCQAPMYFLQGDFLGAVDEDGSAYKVVYPERNNSGNFGLDVYEPHFLAGRGDWLAAAEEGDSDLGYEVKLTLTDQAYTNDLFYFCHIHNSMSGRIKQMTTGEASVLQEKDEPELGYSYEILSRFDDRCGTARLGSYAGNEAVCGAGKFTCGDGPTPEAEAFNECLHALDCAMHEEMRVKVHPSDPITLFLQQMIPHHENAVNMAKATLKLELLTANNDPEGEIEELLWSIINNQNMQIYKMTAWLANNGRASVAEANCGYDGDCVADTSIALLVVIGVCLAVTVAAGAGLVRMRARGGK